MRQWYHGQSSAMTSEDEDEDLGPDPDDKHLKALAEDPRRAYVEAALMKSDMWKRPGMRKSERPCLQRVLASPSFLGLIQATGGDPEMVAMLVDVTSTPESVAQWRMKDARLDQCASLIEDQWVKRVASSGLVERLEGAAGGGPGLARQVAHQLSGLSLPRFTLDDALQQLSSALQPPGKAYSAPQGSQPLLLPPFVLTQALLRLCPPRARLPEPPLEGGPKGRRRQPRHRQLAAVARKAAKSSSEERLAEVVLAVSPSPHAALLDGWHFILPCRWSNMDINPTLTHMVAATERLRAAAIIDTATLAAAASSADGAPGGAHDSKSHFQPSTPTSLQASLRNLWQPRQQQPPVASARGKAHVPPPPPRQRQPQHHPSHREKHREAVSRGDFRPSFVGQSWSIAEGGSWGGPSRKGPPVVRVGDLYPGAVGPMALLNKEVEVRPLRLSSDWQPMLRPTKLRESFFFNPDAGRNAPILKPEWGLGPSMAAFDPLLPFDPEAPLLQAPLLDPGFVSLCKGLDKEPALRRARATVRVARRWAPSKGGRTPGRPVLFFITSQAGYDIRTIGKVRQSVRQFYKRGREVVSTLLRKHSFDTVFVYMTSHYVDTLDSWILTHFKAKDFILLQGNPGAVRAPVRPAPTWSAVPYAAHGRVNRENAPEPPGKEHLLAGLEAYQPILRDAPALLRKFQLPRAYKDH